MKVKTNRDLNIRFRQPNSHAPLKGVIYKGFEIEVEGSVSGQMIAGENKWYYDKYANYYWAGGMDEVEEEKLPTQEESSVNINLPLDLSNKTLKLGDVDRGSAPSDLKTYLSKFHESAGVLVGSVRYKEEAITKWNSTNNVQGTNVKELQTVLKYLGFYPKGPLDGIYGYKTQSAVRLFQEYMRSETNETTAINNSVPDGIAGPMTKGWLNKMLEAKAPSKWDVKKPTGEYKKWMNVLSAFQAKSIAHPSQFQLSARGIYSRFDTLKPTDWNTEANDIHLIGIRKNAQISYVNTARGNDDLFVLLINGQVFQFYGSTDPSSKMTSRNDEPYLLEGQHVYRFGWHKLSTSKVYRAFKPFKNGVAVIRDQNNNDALDASDKVDTRPNLSINIHWSGMGVSNWSAGCQVVAGSGYLKPDGSLADCSKVAARTYSDLGVGGKARGAYSVLLDLITVNADNYSLKNGQKIYYTLIPFDYLSDANSSMAKKVNSSIQELTKTI